MPVFTDAKLQLAYRQSQIASECLTAIRRGMPDLTKVMANPPAVANPASDGANSTINESATVATTGNNCTAQAGRVIQGHSSGFAFFTTSAVMDFALRCNGGNYCIYVLELSTGIFARVSSADLVPFTNNSNFYKLTFAADAPRIIFVFTSNVANNNGVNVPAGYLILPVPSVLTGPRVLVIGDSFIEGSMNDGTKNLKLALADWLAAGLGCLTPTVNGIGSTGLLANAGGSNYNSFLSRQNAGDFTVPVIGEQDIILLCNSINDQLTGVGGLAIPAGDATIQALQTQFVSQLMVDQPNAIILGIPQEFTPGTPAVYSRVQAHKVGFLRAAGQDARLKWIDGTPYESAPVTGMLGADTVHPGGVLGTSSIAAGILSAMVPALTSLI